MNQSLVIYNCETCMFITRNKKDYTRHLKSRKHLENHPTDDNAVQHFQPVEINPSTTLRGGRGRGH